MLQRALLYVVLSADEEEPCKAARLQWTRRWRREETVVLQGMKQPPLFNRDLTKMKNTQIRQTTNSWFTVRRIANTKIQIYRSGPTACWTGLTAFETTENQLCTWLPEMIRLFTIWDVFKIMTSSRYGRTAFSKYSHLTGKLKTGQRILNSPKTVDVQTSLSHPYCLTRPAINK